MSIPAKGWKNKAGTSERSPDCSHCGSWINHWVNNSGEPCPEKCSVLGCNNKAVSGAHIVNSDPEVTGEYIIPACSSCNNPNNTDEFTLKGKTILISANQDKCKMKKKSKEEE